MWVARSIFAASLLASFGIQAMAQPGERPWAVLKQFCRLDMAGARLTAPGPEVRRIYMAENPGWDELVVVERCAPTSVEVSGLRASVTVEYGPLAKLDADGRLQRLSGAERVYFKLRFANGDWRITDPALPPHVSKAAARQHLEMLIRRGGAEAQRTLGPALAQLKASGRAASPTSGYFGRISQNVPRLPVGISGFIRARSFRGIALA